VVWSEALFVISGSLGSSLVDRRPSLEVVWEFETTAPRTRVSDAEKSLWAMKYPRARYFLSPKSRRERSNRDALPGYFCLILSFSDSSEATLAVPVFGERLGLLTRSPLRVRMTAPREESPHRVRIDCPPPPSPRCREIWDLDRQKLACTAVPTIKVPPRRASL
jgi:hypothetical protein